MTLPLELLIEVFKYNDHDYKTLYSCILVNKHWYNINIPILWKNPFYSKDSTKIIINCLLEEDKHFLTRNSIELTFELLDKSPPLYNYAKFCTRFNFIYRHIFESLLTNTFKLNILQNRLAKFILDHSAVIKEFNTTDINFCQVNSYHRFDNSFQNLNKLVCHDPVSNSDEFIDKLVNICKCIQSLTIHGKLNDKFEDSLARLIKAQNQVKQLTICLYFDQILSDNLKKAILAHSQSIIYYSTNGKNNINNMLLPALENLKTLSLITIDDNIKWMKYILLPNIECVKLGIYRRSLPSEFFEFEFIKINGKTIKCLEFRGTNDQEFLRKLFQSIAQQCKNLVDLSIPYNDELNQELAEVFNNCIKLESTRFFKTTSWDTLLDGDKILSMLNQTSPKKLKSIMFPCESYAINVNSLDNLTKNWRGPKPFTIMFSNYQILVG